MRHSAWLLVLFVFSSCASLGPKPKPPAPPKFVAAWEKACRGDEERYCSAWTDRDGTRMDCLARAEKNLAGRCYQALREAATPCVFDRARWCSQFKPSDPRVWGCLTEHGKEVSLSCRTFRSEVASREKSLRKHAVPTRIGIAPPKRVPLGAAFASTSIG